MEDYGRAPAVMPTAMSIPGSKTTPARWTMGRFVGRAQGPGRGGSCRWLRQDRGRPAGGCRRARKVRDLRCCAHRAGHPAGGRRPRPVWTARRRCTSAGPPSRVPWTRWRPRRPAGRECPRRTLRWRRPGRRSTGCGATGAEQAVALHLHEGNPAGADGRPGPGTVHGQVRPACSTWSPTRSGMAGQRGGRAPCWGWTTPAITTGWPGGPSTGSPTCPGRASAARAAGLGEAGHRGAARSLGRHRPGRTASWRITATVSIWCTCRSPPCGGCWPPKG